MKKDKLKQLVRAHFSDFENDEKTQQLLSMVNYDVYFGPYEQGHDIDNSGVIYPGFNEALREVVNNLPEINDLYIDTQWDYVTDQEPQGEQIDGEWIEPYWEDWYKVDRKEVLGILLGEVANYI